MKITNPVSTGFFSWDPNFQRKYSEKFKRAQEYIDSSCIRYMDKYTPRLNGILIGSATLGTVIGSGVIEYDSPYARYQYYGKLMVKMGEKKVLTNVDLKHNTSYNPNAGPFWFEKMKDEYGDDIRNGAERIIQT